MVIFISIQNMSCNGGTERMAANIANAFVLQGHNVHIVSMEPVKESFFHLHESIVLHSLNVPASKLRARYFLAVSRLRSLLKKSKADIIIDDDIFLSALSIPATIWLKTKVIGWEEYNYFSKTESKVRVWARKLAAKYAYAIVVLTKEDEEQYRASCKVSAKIIPIPNYVDELPQQSADLDKSVVLAVGHLTFRKGFDMLLSAWALVKEEQGMDEWKLYIVGNGEEKEALVKQATELRLGNSVVFFLPTKDIAQYYTQSSIFTMTSRSEGLPLVMVEAKAYGLPMVSFATQTGPTEIIRDGIDGYVVSQDDVQALKDRLVLLMRDKELRLKMSGEAKKDAVRFSGSEAMKLWYKLLDEIPVKK